MWPPTLVVLLARATMAMAFQRTMLLILGDGVQVRGVDAGRAVDAGGLGPVHEGVEEELGPLRPLGAQDGLQGLHPLGRLLRVDVDELVGDGRRADLAGRADNHQGSRFLSVEGSVPAR